MRQYMKSLPVLIGLLVMLPAVGQADLYTYGFRNITNNNPIDAAIGEAQLFVNVSSVDESSNQVLFTFRNEGPLASSITRIYFDDGTLLGIAALDSSPGVDFNEGGSPPNLPGGNSLSPPFVTTVGFLATSNPPTQPNGVNPGEWLGVFFNLLPGKTFDDVIEALALGLSSPGPGTLRIGIHVQGFEGGGSESFVNVPLPGAVLLGFLGLSAAGLRLRRFA